jgi:DNA-binding LacI/PurR family transcriptional regulator
VLATARDLGYQPNTSARALRSGKTHAVACLFSLDGHGGRSTYDGAAEIIAARLGAHGYHVVLHVFADPAKVMQELEDLVRGHTSDAFVLFGSEQNVALQGACLEQYGVPFVVKGRLEAQFPHWAQVDYDHEAMMHRVVDHLTGLGHRRIAYVGYSDGQAYSEHLVSGFREAVLSRLGAPAPDLYIGRGEGGSVAPHLERWLALPLDEQPTALAVGMGNTAWREVEEALARVGRVIGDGPGEFSVAGQANHNLSLAFGHGLYFEDISLESLAETAVVDLLLPLLNGEPLQQPVRRILPELRPVGSQNLRRYCAFLSPTTTV